MSFGTPSPPTGPTLATTEPLDPTTGRLLEFAAAVAAGGEEALVQAAVALQGARVPEAWIDELILQSVLMVGYPRALVAAAVWRRVSGLSAPTDDPSLRETAGEWEARGQATCRLIYGANYQRLRENVRALHPALDRWMIVEGYGRVLSRPGLDLGRRELCSIAQIAVLGTARQLHSHLRGALNAGASPAAIDAALEAARPYHTPDTRAMARATWLSVRGGEGSGGA